MGTAALETFLNKHSRLAVDSMVFIYHIESHPDYVPLTTRLFQRIEKGRNSAVTSTLSLTEVLTLPLRKKETELAVLYRGLLMEFPHLSLLPLDPSMAELAASVRAHYNLTTPDAIQIATALRAGATAFVTNDAQLQKVRELKTLLLKDFI